MLGLDNSPKYENPVIIYSASSISKPVWMCFSEHKGRYSEEWGKQSGIFFSTMEVNGVPKQPDYKLILQNIFLCVRQNKHIHTGLEILEAE